LGTLFTIYEISSERRVWFHHRPKKDLWGHPGLGYLDLGDGLVGSDQEGSPFEGVVQLFRKREKKIDNRTI